MASDNAFEIIHIKSLKGVGDRRARLYEKLGVTSVGALLRHYPRGYEDWSNPLSILDAPIGEPCCIKAVISSPVKENLIRKGMILYRCVASDKNGVLQITLFNNRFLAAKLTVGKEYLFYGRCTGNLLRREMASPDIEPSDYAKIRPLYHSTEGLSSRIIEASMKQALILAENMQDPLPENIIESYHLMPLSKAIHNIHFPADNDTLDQARRRLIFEELFFLQIGLRRLKARNRGLTSAIIENDYTGKFFTGLPFSLTGAQKRVIAECIGDMCSARPMNRLVQGDVGSGKTAVAAALCHTAIKNGMQAAMMAPTEILADQHYRSISALLSGSGIHIGLLTGSATKKEKELIKNQLADGEIQLIIGTHALLQDNVELKSLGLVITDEQHRFGVAQRGTLAAKGDNPHLLVMSATPIPRTLALMVYGDLDVSVIDELPPGRQPVETYAVSTKLRERAYNYVKKHIDEGRQGYIVCPLVEEGETDLVPVKEYAEKLSSGAFRNYRVGLLHGKMKSAEKDDIMRRFNAGEIQLLVATTVIEVGVDVPNAVIMVIENTERFGLSQLHQLRGRIGRGEHKSTCILISDSQNEEALCRMKIMSETCDGFKIADEDLKLRGPGDFFGKRQHGLPSLKIADMLVDMDVLKEAGKAAESVLLGDPSLSDESHKELRRAVDEMFSKASEIGLN